jgi:hypothetical protein
MVAGINKTLLQSHRGRNGTLFGAEHDACPQKDNCCYYCSFHILVAFSVGKGSNEKKYFEAILQDSYFSGQFCAICAHRVKM